MKSSFDTLLIHGGATTDPRTGAVNTPIYQTSTYAQSALGVNLGYEYSRTKNPTRDGIESLIAECENGKFGFAFASGMAAIGTILSLFSSGDCIIISHNIYGGTFRILDKVFTHFNINYKIIDTRDLDALRAAITQEVKAVLIESPANPLLNVTPLAQVANLCKEKGILSIVDNTFMTPYLQKPLELGIDIVVHSATKYLGGHSDLIAGLVVVNDEELAQRIGFLQNSIGGVLAPFDSFLLIRGIKTLGLRMQRHCENALFLANALSEHSAVKKVYYPGLQDDEGYEIQNSQARGAGGMISFELKENYDYRIFFKSTRIIALAESLGGVESLLCHPASMTHASIPKDIRENLGISEQLIRLSVGIEYAQDLLDDIKQAIKLSKQ
ncbi:trans-sulfuration enzyme family protein [Helicobacter typhlonius]|uniref:Cystathionine gamma-lyase n=3 Tax=Helicobacter typhlonius TaxID=76936 RepID=A0A099UIH5_9HELI|nr:PLP-dependent aspartate aminotransferase family protein [Helicobacter typhlonius]TLD78449.1 PLP-dependent transferase [Helicobacter typhlonius]CUU39689.1 Cystathionine gamma-lyase [Helicobacter typhlonius]HCD73021.1 PLP-dependent transferase [Helicobacter sp.]